MNKKLFLTGIGTRKILTANNGNRTYNLFAHLLIDCQYEVKAVGTQTISQSSIFGSNYTI